MMTGQPQKEAAATDSGMMPAAASELNNLLQIVAGTVSMLENIWEGNAGSEKYFDMLRVSVARAANVTEQIARQAGGTDRKILLHPSLLQKSRVSAQPKRQLQVSRSILLVDDESMALELTAQILAEAGYEVMTAQSGFEALDLFVQKPNRFDLVLLDLNMPIMDGEEVLKRIRAINPRVPVLLNTGFIDEIRLERMMTDGLSGFLRRPYRSKELLENIQATLKRARNLPEDSASTL